MSLDFTSEAANLLSRKNFKKALKVIKKQNNKKQFQTAKSLQIEGVCHAQNKQYRLAEIAFKSALSIENIDEERVEILNNLKANSIIQKSFEQAIWCFEELIKYDSPAKVVQYARNICLLAIESNNYKKLDEFLEKLKNTEEAADIHFVKAAKLIGDLSLGKQIALEQELGQIDFSMIDPALTNRLSVLVQQVSR